MVPYHQTSSARDQFLVQAIQLCQSLSRIGFATTRPRNLLRETKDQWANLGRWTSRTGVGHLAKLLVLLFFA
jgi:hypothetical protein